MRHRRITNGGTAEDAYNDTLLLFEAKLVLMNKILHHFLEMLLVLSSAEMLCVNPQLATKLDYDRDVLHGYINQNLPRFNICQESTIIAVFNVIAQGEGVVFFLDDPGGLGKTLYIACYWHWFNRTNMSPLGLPLLA